MMRRYLLIVSLIVLIVTGIQCKQDHFPAIELQKFDGDSVCSALGMNAHLLFSCSNQHMEQLCKSMSDAGVKIVRLDMYWKNDNMYFQQSLLDQAIYYVYKYGMEVCLNMPQPPLGDNNFIEKWCEMIRYYVKRYDGNTKFYTDQEGNLQGVCVRYFEIMNEPEYYNMTVEKCYRLIKLSSDMVRCSRQDSVFVVLPAICKQNKYDKDLINYTDDEGNNIGNYVDVLNFHFYKNTHNEVWSDLKRWLAVFRVNEKCSRKKIWVTEFGNSLWDVTEKQQALLLPQQALISLVFGIDKVFYYQYHQFGGNAFENKNQREDFFGIIDHSVTNSYGAFLKNNGKFNDALTDGDASKKIYINSKHSNKFSLYSLTSQMCNELKNNGVVIGGRGFTINRIVLRKEDKTEDVIYQQEFIIPAKGKARFLKLSAQLFSDLDISDQLIVYVKNVVNVTDKWAGLKTLQAYHSYQTLSRMLGAKSTRPHLIDTIDDVICISWVSEGQHYYALWSRSGEKKRIRINGYNKNVSCYDYLGNQNKNANRTIIIDDKLVFLVSKENLQLAN